MIRGVDVSNWNGELTVAQVQSWGVEHVVVRLSHERQGMVDLARRQLQVCRDAGCSVSGYTWAYFTEDPTLAAETVWSYYGGENLPFWWVDCEDTKYVRSPALNSAWLQQYLDVLASYGQRVGIYTGRWWWVPYMDNTDQFASYPAWAAQYDGIPDLAVWTRFGGWDTLWGKQYSGSPLDLDVFDERVLGEGEDMGRIAELEQQVADLRNLLGYFQGDVADAQETAIEALRNAKTLRAVRSVTTGGLVPVLETLRRGGPPS